MSSQTTTISTPVSTAPCSFNLWTEPWISVLDCAGRRRQVGIRDCLVTAHELHSFSDPSPLVVASLQRLLAAIAQDIERPRHVDALAEILRRGHFDQDAVDQFGERFGHRFDLFSETTPFLQTGDIGPELPKRKSGTKTVGYLFPEEPTATNINHFFHRYDDEHAYSPATAASGLITFSAFALAYGQGNKPSINGVPPLYVLPAGTTLFETLALSIITPDFQPRIASPEDRPAWDRDPIVERSKEVLSVGYLESLTFPARRVRLFPEATPGRCTRSGAASEVLVRCMVFEMGHSRPKGAAFWFDPFAAYRLRGAEEPVPIRPQAGRAFWREYGNLFQTLAPDADGSATDGIRPPAVVEQVAELQVRGITHDLWQFRCIGIRTDKGKIFEWFDETLDVPVGILADPIGQLDVQIALERAEQWNRRLLAIHKAVYKRPNEEDDEDKKKKGKKDKEKQRFLAAQDRMRTHYWSQLADRFRDFVLETGDESKREKALRRWTEDIFVVGQTVLDEACSESGNRRERLRLRAIALTTYRIHRAAKAKEWLE